MVLQLVVVAARAGGDGGVGLVARAYDLAGMGGAHGIERLNLDEEVRPTATVAR